MTSDETHDSACEEAPRRGAKRKAASDISAGRPRKRFRLSEKAIPRLEKEIKALDNLMSGHCNGETKAMVLRVHRGLQLQEAQRCSAAGPSIKAANMAPLTARLTGLGLSTVTRLVSNWRATSEIKARAPMEPRQGTVSRRVRKPVLRKCAQALIRNNRAERKATFAQDVLDDWIANGIFPVLDQDKEAAALRWTQRFLVEHGFERGNAKGAGYHELASVKKMIALYIQKLEENRGLPVGERLREVYVDDSYIHNNHNLLKQGLRDASDKKDKSSGVPTKGQRFCFVAAMRGPNPRAPNSKKPVDQAGVLKESFMIFKNGDLWNDTKLTPLDSEDKKKARVAILAKENLCSRCGASGHIVGHCKAKLPVTQDKDFDTQDYHRNFNQEVFLMWLSNHLLPLLVGSPSLIILDNASYHRAKDQSVPNIHQLNRAELLKLCKKYSINLGKDAKLFNPQIVDIIKSSPLYVADARPAVVKLCEVWGHKVAWTPPYESDFQPIEKLWAFTKRRTAKDYRKGRKMDEVRHSMGAHMEEVDGDLVTRWIKRADRMVRTFQDAELARDEPAGDAEDAPIADLDTDSDIDDESVDGDDG